MEMCYEILVQEKRVTQRELFYKLLCASPDYFSSQLQVNQTIQGQVLVSMSLCSGYMMLSCRLCLRYSISAFLIRSFRNMLHRCGSFA